MKQFVHVGIIKLIMNGVSSLAPRTMQKRSRFLEEINRGDIHVVQAENKVALLDDLLSECGAELILNIGECCKSSCDFPLLYFFFEFRLAGNLGQQAGELLQLHSLGKENQTGCNGIQ